MPIHDWNRVARAYFHHFHQNWIASLSNALNSGGLPEGYYALAEAYAGEVVPDVLTLRLPQAPGGAWANGGPALATAEPRTKFVRRTESSLYAAKANLILVKNVEGRVVAAIEIVSPGNKLGRSALQDFVKKAIDFLGQGVNLLIIDLFPPSSLDPQGIHQAIWQEIENEPFQLPPGKPLTLAAYEVAADQTAAYIEPVAAGDVLPAMPLFLAPGYHVPAPLEATYESTYAACPKPMRALLEAPAPRGEA